MELRLKKQTNDIVMKYKKIETKVTKHKTTNLNIKQKDRVQK